MKQSAYDLPDWVVFLSLPAVLYIILIRVSEYIYVCLYILLR